MRLKGRPAGQPSIVLVADLAMLSRYAQAVPLVLAEELDRAHERPTTFILPASRVVASGLLGPDGTVGLRVPQGRVLPEAAAAPGAWRGLDVGQFEWAAYAGHVQGNRPGAYSESRSRGGLAAGRRDAGDAFAAGAAGRRWTGGRGAGVERVAQNSVLPPRRQVCSGLTIALGGAGAKQRFALQYFCRHEDAPAARIAHLSYHRRSGG